jgi:HSP20 family protein
MAHAVAERDDVQATTPANVMAHNLEAATDHNTAPNTQLETAQKQEVQAQSGAERTRTGRVYKPAVDIYETRESVVVVADMPGVDENSVEVTLESNVLTVRGRVEPHYPAGYNLLYAEYGIGDYERSFTISNEIDWEHIEGTVHNGVLTLTLPKVGPAKARTISVRGA